MDDQAAEIVMLIVRLLIALAGKLAVYVAN
jgi:hypothetical protein